MTKSFPFQNTEWILLVVISAIVIWLLFIWKERSKYPNYKFFLNSIVALIAISTLSILILKPLMFSLARPFKVAITTNGFKEKQLDSLKKEYENLVTYNYDPENKLLEDRSIPESVFILGDGIKNYDLWQLDAIKTIYLGGNEPKGIVNLNYDNQSKIGKQAIFKGTYLNALKGHKLILETPDKKSVDSIVLIDKKAQNFQLVANLNVKGSYLYHLTEKDSLGNIISSDPLPMTVSGEHNLKILIINNFPTFETKYLKNFLAEKGHEVIVRSQITKNRYKYEYFNTKTKPNIDFSQKNLEVFDLLLIDISTLNKLSRSNKNTIKQAVKDDGLGVFIQSDMSLFGLKNNFSGFNFIKNNTNSIRLKQWPRNKINVFPYRFKNELSLQPIHIFEAKIVSAYQQFGLGKIGTSSFKNTYQLLLDGNNKIYQGIWAEIIENVSKKNITIADWDSESLIAFQNEPFAFNVATQIAFPSLIDRDSLKLALKQHIDVPTLWEGITYPKEIGWQKLRLEKDTTEVFNFYVANNSKWQSLKSYKTIGDNKRHFRSRQELKKGTLKSAEPINLTWLFIVFIISIGYLWLAPKL